MWERKELKKQAKNVVKKNYWTAIIVCFIVALITGEFGTSIIGMWDAKDSLNNYIFNDIDKDFFSKENIEKTLDTTQEKVLETFEANLNSALKSQKYILKIWDAVKSFNINETEIGIVFCICALIAITFTIFIADPLIVGGKRYFLKAKQNNNTKVWTMVDVYKKSNWFNVVQIMFLRNIYNALWYLTIIGGIIKTYEYRMIPYILAENPQINRKEAFKLSKQLMQGNKWKTFLLDMSFFGWNFLSVLTFGILSILYVNAYNSATIVELYDKLKENNIQQ